MKVMHYHCYVVNVDMKERGGGDEGESDALTLILTVLCHC